MLVIRTGYFFSFQIKDLLSDPEKLSAMLAAAATAAAPAASSTTAPPVVEEKKKEESEEESDGDMGLGLFD